MKLCPTCKDCYIDDDEKECGYCFDADLDIKEMAGD